MKTRLLILAFFFFLSCDTNTADFTESETIVIEAYLFAGQPIDSVKISQLLPLITEEGKSYDISDANVFIKWNNTDYLLTPDLIDEGRYFYSGTELQITEGETYEIFLDYFNETISSETIVPEKPVDLEISDSRIEIEQINDFRDLFDREEIPTLEVYWDNPNSDYYFSVVENIEDNPEIVNNIDFDGETPNFNFVTEPTNLDVFNVLPFSFSHYGTHRVILYRVNQEYVDLYETADQDSRNLTEPLTNIINGLGIFTSFSSDTLFFEVVKP